MLAQKKLKHTAGPWHVGPVSHVVGETFGVFGPNGQWIAKCHPFEDSTVKQEEARANAVLLANAPRLLASLQELSEWMRSHCGEGNGTHEMLCRAVEAIIDVGGEVG